MIYVATEKSRVRIAINDVSAPVLVKVDGNTIDIAGLQSHCNSGPVSTSCRSRVTAFRRSAGHSRSAEATIRPWKSRSSRECQPAPQPLLRRRLRP